jgi:putative endonuclease
MDLRIILGIRRKSIVRYLKSSDHVQFTEGHFEVFANIFKRHLKTKTLSDAASDREIGIAGERLAGQFLGAQQYRILDLNWSCAVGEIDIVCEFQNTLIFVEVKTSRKSHAIPPEARVNHRKQHKLRALAECYMKSKHLDMPCRFDVVAIWWKDKQPQIQHFTHAF